MKLNKMILYVLSLILALTLTKTDAYPTDIINSAFLLGPETPLFVAREKSFYSQFGLQDDFEYLEIEKILDYLRKGRKMVSLLPVISALNEIKQNKELVVFGVIFQGLDYSIWVKPGMNDLKEIGEAGIAVPEGMGLERVAPFIAFSKMLIDPNYLHLQPLPKSQIYYALKKRAIGGAIVRIPWEKEVKRLGLRKIYDLSTLRERLPHTVMISTKNYLFERTNKVI